ncbi:MAG TPA: hypothetical protein PKD00_00800 [Burkholderiales bacterium]|nr:hypothetical protein [Burkholderiales bacterium]
MEKLILSSAPENKLAAIAYEGQPKENYQYLEGFEDLVSEIPNPKFIEDGLEGGFNTIKEIMLEVVERAKNTTLPKVEKNKFERTVIGVEEAEGEGQEVVLAHWGKHFFSPVHGHSEGLLYEYLIEGKLLINEYFISNLEQKIVRPHRSYIQFPGEIVTTYTPYGTHQMYKRESFIHNFIALEPSVSLHYVPEHTRDGRDNGFAVEHFEIDENELTHINTQQALYSQVGDVILVRSNNVPEYGDHYIHIVGPPVLKPHGLRPQDVSILAGSQASSILDKFKPTNGVILLKLSEQETIKFKNFHKIGL